MKTAILAILLFFIMIVPHEFGHFIAAKLCNVQINEFSIGMGPALWKKQKGETLLAIRAIPFGGYCAMEGEDGQGEEDDEPDDESTEIAEYNPQAFNNKKPWQKTVILAAGSIMNMLTALVIMIVVVGTIGFTSTVLDEIQAGSPAEKAGLQVGDKVISINDTEIKTWNDVASTIQSTDGSDISFVVLRNHKKVEMTLRPELATSYDEAGNEVQGYKVGITCRRSHDPFKAVVAGAESTWNLVGLMFDSIKMLFSGEAGADDLAGPVGMVQMVNETIDYGFWYYGFLAALICVNLAIMNLLPLPALDGGRIVFVLFGWITKKQVSVKVEGTVHAIGLILLLLLMVFVTKNDIVRIFS